MATPHFQTPEGKAEAEDRAGSERLLLDDALESLRALAKDSTPYNRRTAVRTIFACIEGIAFSMRQYCLVLHEAGESVFSAAELAFLREESYVINETGTANPRPARIGLEKMLPFSFAMHARHIDSSYVLNRDSDEWRTFCDALKVRHRITHPRKLSELDVTASEVALVRLAYYWFLKEVMDIRQRSNEPFEKYLEALKLASAKLDEARSKVNEAAAALAPTTAKKPS